MPEQGSLNLGEIGKLIAAAKQLAKRYRTLTGRPIGVTGEVPLNHVTNQIGNKAFARPLSHKAKLDIVKGQLSSRLVDSTDRSGDVPRRRG